MFEYFYNEIFRSVIIGFGSLFNGMEIQRKNKNDSTTSIIKVPIKYGPTQAFLARLDQTPDLNSPTQVTLPLLSFEFVDLQYDPSRKSTQTQAFYKTTDDGSKTKRAYLPVPYNMNFELSIMTKLNDDMLQIVEQILPYFQPSYTLPIKVLGEMKETINVPVQLEGISMEDDYEGNFDTRRALVYTLRFTAKTMLYGPVSDVSDSIINKVSVGYIAGTRSPSSTSYQRDLTYSVVPRATKDYDGSQIATTTSNIDIDDIIIPINLVSGTTDIAEGTRIYLGEETMYVESYSNDQLKVKRAQDNTNAQQHVLGSQIFSITTNDSNFIEVGDDFGFDGSIF